MALTFSSIANFFLGSAAGAVNNNFQKVKDEFMKVLYRDGTLPMLGNLDMNSNKLINVGEATSNTQAPNLGQVKNLISGGVVGGGTGAASNLTVKQNGTTVVSSTDTLNFVGATVTGNAGTATVTVTGGATTTFNDSRDYGAKFDGVTDDSAALLAQYAANTQLENQKGGISVIPAGTTRTSQPMRLGTYSIIEGKGPRVSVYEKAAGAPAIACFQRADGAQWGRSKLKGIGIRGYSTGIAVTDDTDGNDFEDLDISGCGIGIGVSGMWQTSHLDRVVVRNGEKGFVCTNLIANAMRFTKTETLDLSDTHIQLGGAEDFVLASHRFEAGGIIGKYTTDLSACRNLAFDGGYMEGTHEFAAKIRQSRSIQFSKFHFTGTGAAAGGGVQPYKWDTDGAGTLEFHRCHAFVPMRVPAYSTISGGNNWNIIPCVFSGVIPIIPRQPPADNSILLRLTRPNTTSPTTNTTEFWGEMNLNVLRIYTDGTVEPVKRTFRVNAEAVGGNIGGTVTVVETNGVAPGVTIACQAIDAAILAIRLVLPAGYLAGSSKVVAGGSMTWNQVSSIDQNLFGLALEYG
jgi:hypothetical protein